MHKIHINADTVRNGGIKLAMQIHRDEFRPTITYSLLRGGAVLANVINEVLQILQPDHPPLYAAINTRTYDGIHQDDESFYISGWTYDPGHLRPTDRILFIDDIFDSGKTINLLLPKFMSYGIPRDRLKVVVHDYKQFCYLPPLRYTPDYFINCYRLESPADNLWIHYSSHELKGLTAAEREKWYYQNYPELRDELEQLDWS